MTLLRITAVSVLLGVALATSPAASAHAVPSPPDAPSSVATTSSSVELSWGMPCSCDPDRVEVQTGTPGAPWTVSSTRVGFIGTGYRYLLTSNPANFLVYTPDLPTAGTWTVQYNVPNTNSSSLVTSTSLQILHGGVTDTVTMNQRANPGTGWQTLGSYAFDAGSAGSVRISNAGTGGTIVIADGFRFVNAATSTTVTVDDPDASNATWVESGGTPGTERAFSVGHLSSNTTYGFRIRSVDAGVPSTWVTVPSASTPSKNAVVRGTVVAPPGVDNLRNGEGDIIELSDGGLLYVYGRYEESEDFAPATIAAKTSQDGGRTWSAESILFGTVGGGQTFIQPGLVRVDEDTIGISYVVQVETPSSVASRVFSTSDDDGVTWSTPVMMTDGSSAIITGANARLIALESGRLVQVVNLRLPTPTDRSTGIYTSDDGGATWVNRTPTPIVGPDGFIEATVAEVAPDELLLLGRTVIGPSGFLWESRSSDGGSTWSTPTRTDVPQPNSPAFLAPLPSGGVVLITNGDTAQGIRTILASRVSTDGGLTWQNYRQLEYKTPSKASYPALTFAADGAHLIYSTPVGTGEASHLALPADWFETASAYPYAPSTIAHVAGSVVTFTTVSGGQGTVSINPRAKIDGVAVTVTGGQLTLPTGTHTLTWSAIDSSGREEVWQSRVVTG